MNRFARGAFAILASGLLAVVSACSSDRKQEESAGEHGTAASSDYERGPHRGRLLRDGEFALELQIFEEGGPPEFHVYLYRDDAPLPPQAAEVQVELHRLDGEVDRVAFAPGRDHLKGDGLVAEPHSFSVKVAAREPGNGKQHQWAYDSFEGRTTIGSDIASQAGIRTETAGPASIAETLVLAGRIVPNAERVRAVTARFPGQIRKVERSAGDSVRAGERLALVESNESLQTYAITAPIAGTIVDRHANSGEIAGSGPLFVIANHQSLWAEFTFFPRDVGRVKVGQKVIVAAEGGVQGEGAIVRVAPAHVAEEAPGSVARYTARVVLDNADGRWIPGFFVEGRVRIAEASVPLAVKRSGLQSFRDFTVVFEQVGDTYEVRMLELGREDETWVEVLGGLKPRAQYVAENSYLIKADIEKSGASHDH